MMLWLRECTKSGLVLQSVPFGTLWIEFDPIRRKTRAKYMRQDNTIIDRMDRVRVNPWVTRSVPI